MSIPQVNLTRGIHVLHLFYRIDRARWRQLSREASQASLAGLEAICAANAAAAHPRLTVYANVGDKADVVFMLQHKTLDGVAQVHRALESHFPAGSLGRVYSFLSVTELTEYMPTLEEAKQRLAQQEKLDPGSAAFEQRWAEETKRIEDYSHYRLYPELPDWEVMCFYPMTKRRAGADNWYALDYDTRKKLMGGHARTGRKYAGRVVQMITGSTGLDDWEWGVTLVARQADTIKEIVYEMRFDEVSARYGEFGQFFLNLRLTPAQLWEHLQL